MNAIQQQMIVTSPADGTIAYRTPFTSSPRSQNSVLVISQPGGFRFRTRIPSEQLEELKKTPEVSVDLSTQEYPVPEGKISAQFLTAYENPGESDMVVVELGCVPPPEVVRGVAEGTLLKGKMSWRVPLLTMWSVQVGGALIVLGVLGIFAGGFAKAVTATTALVPVPENPQSPQSLVPLQALASSPESPETALVTARSEKERIYLADEIELGTEGVRLRMIGEQLRNAIVCVEINADLLASLEWALAWYQAQAVRIISGVLGSSEELAPRIWLLFDELNQSNGLASNEIVERRRLCKRFLYVIETLCPNAVPPRMGVV
jgi:hypothetical protein